MSVLSLDILSVIFNWAMFKSSTQILDWRDYIYGDSYELIDGS